MNHEEARERMLAARRGALEPDEEKTFRAHLDDCAECRAEDAADAALSRALESLPRAKSTLRAELERKHLPKRRAPSRAIATLLVAAALVIAFVVWRSRRADDAMVTEAVNDHLRVLYSDHPVEVESGGIHQVKPWFAGRVDFAPDVSFSGDDDFPLRGGSVAYFVDRKAAAFVFSHKLHTISLFVFPADGLSWPQANTTVGSHAAKSSDARGFHVLVWRSGDLGHALVSDVDPRELAKLAERVASP